MKPLLLLSVLFLLFTPCSSQINVTFTINTTQDHKPISTYIYGSNGQSADEDENITARRLGGNRLTGYNWENNASNAGNDWYHNNDDYLPSISGIPVNQYTIPNIVYQVFHDTSVAMNCYSLITLPMAGYVARDINGIVSLAETAPSPRFRQVVNRKTSAFSLTPDTTDPYIYIDECLNNLIHQNGLSNSPGGIRGYSMDNEYALWNSTHPRIHPAQPTIGEVIAKSADLARTIKSMDSTAEVFGPVDYGYASFVNFQTAPDWSSYSSYGNFINAYLRGMKLASDSSGRRLLDVLDVHWYPEARGMNNAGTLERVVGGSNDRGVAQARMQCPRTLWDSSYVEDSWIGQYFSPCVYVHALKNGIDTYNPSTKLAFTEFDYGGSNHISGGIAIADVLGIFGKYGVYMGNFWGPLNDYISTAYKIYRNYDGNNSTFGDEHVNASTTNIDNSSIYASLESNDSTKLHLIVMNKNFDSTLTADFFINSPTNFTTANIWGFDSTTTSITHVSTLNNISGNHIVGIIPPLSVFNIVMSTDSTTGIADLTSKNTITISPNPASESIRISGLPVVKYSMQVENIVGQKIFSSELSQREIDLNIASYPDGVYFLKIYSERFSALRKFIKK